MKYSYCKYCNRQVPSNQIVVKSEKHIVNGQIQTVAWVGCKICWKNLQKVS